MSEHMNHPSSKHLVKRQILFFFFSSHHRLFLNYTGKNGNFTVLPVRSGEGPLPTADR